ncbi:MAG TPA: hypothetical protein VEX64_07720, partial [Pyrinomonadaceae bacterium]|nr:hypothetical protein [Pyrinomonadaceae bacterium]
MKNLIYRILIFLTVLSAPVLAQNNVNIEGNWLGTLEINGIKMRLLLKVSKTADGFAAKLDSIDQGANDL